MWLNVSGIFGLTLNLNIFKATLDIALRRVSPLITSIRLSAAAQPSSILIFINILEAG